MISEKDAANASLAKIADAFIKKGHEVEIFATFYASNVLRFFDPKITIHKFEKLTKEIAETFDCIFTSSVTALFFQNGPILSLQIPIFTQNYLINKQLLWRGDVCYVPSLPTSVTDYDDYLLGSKIAIGEPKYDMGFDNGDEGNMLLFIDSGHYPFGEEGKKALADTLLQICDKFPDYWLVIKPRFLPQDKIVTHRNKLHLYDVLREQMGENIRTNLVMLTEHLDLMELIGKSHTVICMHTTAFVGAYIRGKGLVVLDDLPSDDIYDTRLKTSYRIREFIEPSGALVNYKSVVEVLPDGVTADEQYISYLLSERENVADKIVDCTVQLCEKFFFKGKFPSQIVCDYKDVDYAACERKDWSWNDEINLRYKDFLFYRMMIHIDFHVKSRIHIDSVWSELDKIIENSEISQNNLKIYINKAYELRNKCIVENRDIMVQDEVDQGILLNALYSLGYYEEVKNFPVRDIGAFYYYNALVANREKNFDLCEQNLVCYDRISYGRMYIKEISDMPNNRIGAYILLIKLLIKRNDLRNANDFLAKIKKIYCSIYCVNELSQKCEAKEQYQNYIYIKWLEGSIEKKLSKMLLNSKYFVYGAGEICKKTLLEDEDMRKNIIAIIDQYCTAVEICGLPVIRLNMLEKYRGSNKIIVTLPYQFEEISRDIMEVAPRFEIYSIENMIP